MKPREDLNLKELNQMQRYTELFTLILLSTINDTDVQTQDEPDDSFRWRDRYGKKWKPKEMSTKHLFYTWLMIWNHSVPAHYTIWFSNHYEFIDEYSNEYMQLAFHKIYHELKRRTDLGSKSREVIRKIEKFIEEHPELEEIKIQ